MTIIETRKLLALIQGFYPRFADGRDLEMTQNAWRLIFAEDDFAAVQKALIGYVATDVKGFPPMPGALKDRMRPKVSEADAYLAWRDVRKPAATACTGAGRSSKSSPPSAAAWSAARRCSGNGR